MIMEVHQIERTNLINDNYELWGLYVRISNLIGKAREIELARYGVTREQSHILHILNDSRGVATLNQIAATSLRRHNTVSAIIQRMEKSGLVSRNRNSDTREYQISITEKGQHLYEKTPKVSIDMVFSVLTNNEKQTFVRYLNKLEQKVSSMLGIDFKIPF
jgi:DNA-binding MarR family transcriptional regulator